jgi:uncharacterized protein (TIGR03083 family)
MIPGMEIDEHLDTLHRQGELLAETAAAADLDIDVPTCPGWTVRDLVRHVGGVHRWATTHIVEQRETLMGKAEEDALMARYPAGDDELFDWYRAGHRTLIESFEKADPAVPYWSLLPAPTPLAFWVRRLTHETTMHRVDVQNATGAVDTVAPELAADGIHELLHGFFSISHRPRCETSYSLHVHATDSDGEWLIQGGPDGLTVTDEHAKADFAVRGPVDDLYRLLWNRRGTDGLEVFGDPSVLDLWRGSAQVHW